MTRTTLTLTLAAASVVALSLSGCSSMQNRQIYDRTDQTRSSAEQVQEGYDTFGRKWGRTEVAEAKAPAAPAAPAPAPPPVAPAAHTRVTPEYASLDLKTGLVNLTKRVPAAASVGEQYSYDLAATAVEDAGYVIVTDTIPDGATYIKSDPEATRDGNLLTWKFPAMKKGEAKNIKVWLKPDREGELAGCATVTAVPRNCIATVVGKPVLDIQKSGPEWVVLGSNVTYNIVVNNKGTSVAKNVVVTDAVPEGLVHAGGQTALTFNVGDLAPKQSRTLPVTFRAAKRGKACNTVVASSSNAGKVQAEACTVIVQPGLQVTKTGDNEQYLGRNARYSIVVTNTGDTTLTGVVVTDTAPAATKIVTADGARVQGNSAVWNIAELRPGQDRALGLTLTSEQPGNHCNSVSVIAGAGLRDSAQACTLWKGLSAILIELVDNPDPIMIGESTTFTIRVTNQGTANDNNVNVVANFPKELEPTAASGGTIAGKTVRFPVVAQLSPKQVITYTIQARGAVVGDARLKVLLNSDNLTSPVTEEESSTVY